MKLRHAPVIALEERQKILRQIVLVELGQGTHDTEVQGDIAAQRGGVIRHIDVARVHVRVKETVGEDLHEKDLDPLARQQRDVHAQLAQPVDVADGHAVHALHGEDLAGTIFPDDFRHLEQMAAPGVRPEIAPQLAAVGSLAQQIKLIVQVFVELGHHFARLEAAAVRRQPLDQPRQHAQQHQIPFYGLAHARTQDFDRHLAAIVQHGKMHLRDRGRGHGIALELREQHSGRLTQGFFDDGGGLVGRERRHLVLQAGQFVGDILGDQIAPGGEDLAGRHGLLRWRSQAGTRPSSPPGDSCSPRTLRRRQRSLRAPQAAHQLQDREHHQADQECTREEFEEGAGEPQAGEQRGNTQPRRDLPAFGPASATGPTAQPYPPAVPAAAPAAGVATRGRCAAGGVTADAA
ncbi:hypothetical protein CDEF62S_05792 [Castellaniella defragrans]